MPETKTSMPKDALAATLEAARLANPLAHVDGRDFIILPNGMTLKDVTNPEKLERRAKVSHTLDEKASAIDYINRFRLPGTIVVADFDTMSIKAVIDYHGAADGGKPGDVAGCDHLATFKLRPSEEWTRWDGFEGKLHKQEEFAAFLEENAVDIHLPEPATIIEISRDLEAVQVSGFKSSNRLENGDRSFVYETETKAQNDVVVPTKFTLNIPLYQGEGPVELQAALRWRATGEGVMFGFEWRRVQYQRLAYFRAIATEVAEGTGAPVFYGR